MQGVSHKKNARLRRPWVAGSSPARVECPTRFISISGLVGVVGGPAGIKSPTRFISVSGLVVEIIVAIDVTRVRFPADALVVYCMLLITQLKYIIT